METITFKDQTYPAWQASGFAARFCFPFAKEVCKGIGYDIGCNRLEWALPGAIPVDPLIGPFSATNLPDEQVDYIFSSHCLEHLPDWVSVLDYWLSVIKYGGIIFLYLPDYSQHYWRPWNNRKHLSVLDTDILIDYFEDRGCSKVLASGVDLNHSFTIIAEK